MKKILYIMTMLICIVSCVALMDASGYGDAGTVWIVDPQPQFSTTMDGTYYSTKEALLEHTAEKTLVDKVYVKMNLKVGANSPNTNAKIKSVTVLDTTYNFTPSEKVEVKFGPIGKNTVNKTMIVNYTYKYKDSKGKEQTGNAVCGFGINAADGFDSTTYGKLGNNPTGEIVFDLSGGSSGGVQEASASHKAYRYNETIALKVKALDNASSNDIGVKSVVISGDMSITNNQSTPKSELIIPVVNPLVAMSNKKYEEIENLTYSVKVTDGVGKETTIPSVKVSDYVLKHHTIDAQIIPTSTFESYVDEGEVVIEFKVTYGQEFLKGISNIRATNSDVYVPVNDSNRVKIVEQGEGNYNRVYKVRTKKKPTDTTKSVFLHYQTNEGGDGYTELVYTLSDELAQGYEFDYNSNKIQKFDITNGNLWVDENNIAHYGKVISGLAGAQNIDTDESTVSCNDIIMITGSTNKYIVKIDKGGKKIIFDKGLTITNSDSSTNPIKIKGGTSENTSVVIIGDGKITASGNGQSGIYIDGGVVNFYNNFINGNTHGDGIFRVQSSKGAGISANNGGNINIWEVRNLEITAGGGGAGVGTEANGSGGNIYVMNSPLKIEVTGGGAAIGTGTGGKLSSVKVEGTLRGTTDLQNYGFNLLGSLKVDSGACIGAGNNGTITGTVEVQELAGPFIVGTNGVAIGASSGSTCGKIVVSRVRIGVSKNTSGAGAGIGAGPSAKCGDIKVSDGDVNIEECTVGVGADTNATCGNITIDTESELKISKGEVGIGARSNGSMGNIKISSSNSFSQVDIKTTKVGIGSLSSKTGNSNIEITCPNGNYTSNANAQAEVVINGPSVCIGATDSGKVKKITITNCNKVLLTPATTGVGIGASGSSSEVGDIQLGTSNVRVDSCSVGIGGSGTVGKITVNSCGKVVVKSSKVGIGASNKVGDITVMYSSLQVGDSSSKSEIGIGVSANANMGNITISDRNNLKIYASKIGIGSSSNNTGSSSINIVKGSSTHKGGSNIEIIGISDVGIGTTGVIGKIDVRGNSGSTKVSKIKIKNSSNGSGIGIGSSGTCGDIVVAANIQIGESSTKCKIGIGASGTCGKVEVREGDNVVNNVVIYASNVGIGFDGSTATSGTAIEVRNIKLDISGCSVGIGATSGAKAGNIDISTLEEVDGAAVDISSCGVKIVPTTSGIGIGASGTCGDITCTKMPMQVGSSGTKCTIGIGTSAGSIGNINISSCSGIKIYATDIGIGSGTSNTSGKKVSISSSSVDINGVNVGIGTKGKLSYITIQGGSNIITPKSDGLGIGSLGSGATVGNITLNNTNVRVDDCAVGIGTSGTCGKIKMSGCKNVIIKSSTVGVGGTSGTGAIIIDNCKLQIGDNSKKGAIGIGTSGSSGTMGDMLIRACTMKIYANDVGIGSKSTRTGTNMSGIITYITNSTLDISGAMVGVGAYNGNLGPIMIGNIALGDVGTSESFDNSGAGGNTKIKIIGQGKGTGVGIGSTGGFCANICLVGAEGNISNVSIGIGTDNETKLIKISDYSKVLINGSNVGVGVTSSNANTNLNVENSDVEVSQSTDVGIGTSENGKLDTINLNKSNIKVAVGTNGIGVGGAKVYAIKLQNSTEADIGGGKIAIGVGGNNGRCSSISITGCPKVLAYGSEVCIGNNGLASGSEECVILIDGSLVKVAGNGIGIGGATKGIGEIGISNGSVVTANTGSTGIGIAAAGKCGNISISESEVRVNSTNGGAGIGGLGTVGAITISSSTIDATTNSVASCIGGGNLNIGNISVTGSNIKTNSVDGMGIGGNSFANGNNSRIDIGNSELMVDITGGGTGIGTNTGTLGSIKIENSGVKINGGSGQGVGIGARDGIISGIELSNNAISILKMSGSTGAGIGGGAGGNAGNINLTKNKIVVATGSGAGVGSGAGSNAKVTGTIKMSDGVIIGKSVNGACIGAGQGGSVNYIAIEDGKVNANVTGNGACMGTGSSGSVGTLRIDKGEFVCNAASTAKGISASTLIIKDGDISVNSQNGDALNGSTLNINNGKIEVVSTGANAIKGGNITISDGVVKAKGGTKDINGSSVIITRNANVQAYNNNTTTVKRDSSTIVTQKKLSTDFWRNYEDKVKWSVGSSSGEIKTDSSGDVYFWYNENSDRDITFDMAGKKMVM